MKHSNEGAYTTFLNTDCFPQQHFDEILQQSRDHAEQINRIQKKHCLPRPKNLTEYFIYYINHIQTVVSKRYRPSAYWRYTFGVYKNLFLVFYFNWISIFTSPVSALAFIIAYPIISGLLFAFEIGLKIFMDFLGGSQLVKNISEDYGGGYSIINWGNPQFFESSELCNLIQSTLPALGRPASRDNRQVNDDCRHRTFDISIAQTFTVLSSIVYERHDEKVTKAFKTLTDYNKNNRDKSPEAKEQVESKMKQLIWESEERIRRIAGQYGLHFMGVTELKSLGGPFCGLYWPIDNKVDPFIIVTFKGTTPTNYSEFLVDATLQRTDARAYLFGSAHEGFYDSLFPTSNDSDNADSRDPYYAIQSAIRQKALQLQKDPSKPVKVWVAGHSLGAALGALLFARFLKSPEDIQPMCELRDAYVIGTPAVGDNDFASMFASYTNTPLSRSSNLWRVINKSDIICRIPPGYNNITVGHYLPSTDFFNYSHVGHAVQITHPILNPEPLKIYPSSYQSNLKVDIIVSADTSNNATSHKTTATSSVTSLVHYPRWIRPFLKKRNPIPIIESVYPFFIRDHIPIHYFEGLDRARAYYDMCKKD